MHRKKTKDLPEASEGASDGSRAAGFESKGVVPSLCQSRDGNAGVCRSVAFCVHVSCEAARGMSTAPSMNRTAAWFGVKFLLDMLPAQDRACPVCFCDCVATSVHSVPFVLHPLLTETHQAARAATAMARALASCSAESRTISLKLMATPATTPETAREVRAPIMTLW